MPFCLQNLFCQDFPLKTNWLASASGESEPIYRAEFAIDGNAKTRWSSPGADNQWLQIDIGKVAKIAGVRILWENAYAEQFNVEVSEDSTNWEKVYQTDSDNKGNGKTDIIFFRESLARFIKINCQKRATGWGNSIWELDLISPEQKPRILSELVLGKNNGTPEILSSSKENSQAYTIFDSDLSTALVRKFPNQDSKIILFDLRANEERGGLKVFWQGKSPRDYSIEAIGERNDKPLLARITDGQRTSDTILHKKKSYRFLAFTFFDLPDDSVGISEINLIPADEEGNNLEYYKAAANSAPVGDYPITLLGKQVYWTVLGIPDAVHESLLDEFGTIEPKNNSPTVTPIIKIGDKIINPQNVGKVEQSLEQSWLPVPSVDWLGEEINLKIQALTLPANSPPTERNTLTKFSQTHLLYTVQNKTDSKQQIKFYLLVRPILINPPWQHGGFTELNKIHFELAGDENEALNLFADDSPLFTAHEKPDRFGATIFTRGDIIKNIKTNSFPRNFAVKSTEYPVSAALEYKLNLKANQSKSLLLSFPLDDENVGQDKPQVFNTEIFKAEKIFEQFKQICVQNWLAKIGNVDIKIPQSEITETLKSQIAYILINQDGNAIQPGSRNYNRSWIRDGCITASALLKWGLFDEVKNYLEWYSRKVDMKTGWVPPILNTDGTINKWWGWDNEWDSQGEYVFIMADYYRFTRDKFFLQKHFAKIEMALKHLNSLRDKTLAKDYMEDKPARERFRGILPKSISHEGYDPPMHSYWDDFFALGAWQETIFLANELGKKETANWAKANLAEWQENVSKSIRATIQHHKINYIPGCAEKGDFDATSTAIAFFPNNTAEILPEKELRNTFERYFKEMQTRSKPGWNGAFTPYEVRSVLALLELGEKQKALSLLNYMLKQRRPEKWNHLAEVVHADYRKGAYIGDMPHTWVGSGYVNSVRGLFVKETNKSDKSVLELFAGVPAEWLLEGDGTSIKNLPTHFGTIKKLTAKKVENNLHIELVGDLLEGTKIRIHLPKAISLSTMKNLDTTTTADETIKLDKKNNQLESNASNFKISLPL